MIDAAKYDSVVSEGKRALERTKASGALDTAAEGAIRLLRDESLAVGKEILRAQKREVPAEGATDGEAYLRDLEVPKLCDRGWLLADEWGRNVTKAYPVQPGPVADQVAGQNGVFALAAVCTELLERPHRKTVDGQSGDDPVTGTDHGAYTMAKLGADIALIKKALNIRA